MALCNGMAILLYGLLLLLLELDHAEQQFIYLRRKLICNCQVVKHKLLPPPLQHWMEARSCLRHLDVNAITKKYIKL